jgi:hypothetical protein
MHFKNYNYKKIWPTYNKSVSLFLYLENIISFEKFLKP